MRPFVAILEDNAERAAAMRVAAGALLPDATVFIADDAEAMNEWLTEHLPEVIAISLDHDLPVTRSGDGSLRDHGDGMQVVDFLAKHAPTCPVIVHTSNAQAGGSMVTTLIGHGWLVAGEALRFIEWVDGDWRATLSALMSRGLVHA